MSDKPDNVPAFPEPYYGYTGMSLRDYFAAKAMQGQISSDSRIGYIFDDGSTVADNIAKDAYLLADAMLKARQS